MALEITTRFTIKPSAGQTQQEAEEEFAVLFREYLTNKEGAFQADYAPGAWGGYEGPWVLDVTFPDPGGTR
ncbi:hypothetical protein [Arthrobacter koreensis]|uniref:hypothetical protein n=1 Tax=Arthrobacter koreensis TaxID=199136 RepID=UPI00380E38EC